MFFTLFSTNKFNFSHILGTKYNLVLLRKSTSFIMHVIIYIYIYTFLSGENKLSIWVSAVNHFKSFWLTEEEKAWKATINRTFFKWFTYEMILVKYAKLYLNSILYLTIYILSPSLFVYPVKEITFYFFTETSTNNFDEFRPM